MKQYNRIMLGKGGIYLEECLCEGFIGADYEINQDLSTDLPDSLREFNLKFIPVYLKANPTKTKVAAGLACGMLYTICKGLKIGDIVLASDGNGLYYVGEISGNYYYVSGTNLPHRRRVNWLNNKILRADMSEDLRHSTGSTGTCCSITQYASEIESLMAPASNTITCSNSDVEDAVAFAMEKHLEDFLVKNWDNTPIGKKYNIYEIDGEIVGEQYMSYTGPIDILAISKDKKTLLVIELKKGMASDVVVGQIQRYMGYVKDELAENGQIVKGIIIGLEEDNRLKRALSVTNNIEFYRYQIAFKLIK